MKLINVLALFNLASLSILLPRVAGSEFDLGFNYTRGYSKIGSNTYHYLLCKPSREPIGTIILLHGFPDLSYGWRYQIPTLTSLGFQVIAPDMLGYGRSSAPVALTKFSLKSMSNNLATLINRIVPGEQVILGGHDWRGAMVYRTALWHPELFKGIFSVCTPYFPPTTKYVDLADQIAAGINPTFGYQLQLRNSTYDLYFNAPHRIRQILTALYGGRTPDGELGFDSRTGLIFENLPYLQPSPLIGNADINYYVAQYFKNRMRGPMSIGATQDTALPPEMSMGMEKYFPAGLTRGTVVSSHWALWQASQNIGKHWRLVRNPDLSGMLASVTLYHPSELLFHTWR